MSEIDVVADYADHPEAHRETKVVFDRWGWRDVLASTIWAQFDYDIRRLASLESGKPIAPSPGWSPRKRLLARGAVDAFIAGVRDLSLSERRQVLRAMRRRMAP